MADRVIVVGATRARQRVPVSEIKQMAGRAGRKHSEEACRATIVVLEEHAEDVEREMKEDASFVVTSALRDYESLSFHILPEIVSGSVIDMDSAEKWYSRSLAKFQNQEPDFKSTFELLSKFGAIEHSEGKVKPTKSGEISSRLYLHPADVWAWRENFSTIFNLGIEDEDLAIAWALGTVPITRMRGDFGKYWPVVENCKGGMPPGLELVTGTIITVTLWWYVLGGPPVGNMRSQAMALFKDVGRICRALAWLDHDVEEWGMGEFFEELETRCMKRIPAELSELCKLPKISKGRARYLHNMGIMDVEAIKASLNNLEGEIDDSFHDALKEISNGVCEKSN